MSNRNHKATPAQLLRLLAAQGKNMSQNRLGILNYPKQHDQSAFVNGKTVISTISGLVMTPQPQVCSSAAKTKQTHSNDGNNSNGSRQSPCNETEKNFSSMPPNPKGSTFVICEICDAYIKDLTQLKSHMQHIHKVSY